MKVIVLGSLVLFGGLLRSCENGAHLFRLVGGDGLDAGRDVLLPGFGIIDGPDVIAEVGMAEAVTEFNGEIRGCLSAESISSDVLQGRDGGIETGRVAAILAFLKTAQPVGFDRGLTFFDGPDDLFVKCDDGDLIESGF